LTVRVRAAAAADLERIAELFDQYRQFYQQPADPKLASGFIAQRFSRGESAILVAEREDSGIVGICQMYPSFCSVAAAPIALLYDLFVAPAARRGGAGRALLLAAAEHARRSGAVRMELATARSNAAAQALYESLGWVRDDMFLHYTLAIRQREP
jgi:ribosomal protein S18 acetylase RimI-like enzyme